MEPINNEEEKEVNIIGNIDNAEENLPDPNKQKERIWFIFSIVSWFILISTQFETYISSFFRPKKDNELFKGLPIINLFILLMTTTGFIVYLIFTTCKKDQNLYNSMLGYETKYHFIFFLFASAIFLIDQYNDGNFSKEQGITKHRGYNNAVLIADLLAGLITLGLLLYFYITMKMQSIWYIVLATKKGAFSCLFPYVIYKIIIDIYKLIDNNTDSLELGGWQAAVIILIGGISIILSFVFNDIIIAFATSLMYIRYLETYAIAIQVEGVSTYKQFFLVLFEIISVLVIIVSFFLIGFLALTQKEKIFK